jgi:type III secretory pathway component EscS
MTPNSSHIPGRTAWPVFLVLAVLALLLGIEMVLSLQWRMAHDTPLLHYVAFLLDRHDFVLYRDVFETSMPGTFLLHLAIVKLFGYSEQAFRIVDISSLSLFLLLIWLLLQPLGRAAAWAAVILFGHIYLGFGPAMSLQRDYIGVLPIALALLFVTRTSSVGSRGQSLVSGVLFGCGASIKPHLAVGLPLLLIYICIRDRAGKDNSSVLVACIFRNAAWATIGFVCCCALPFLWLWWNGGLGAFWEMFSSYLPLHIQLSGDHRILHGLEKIIYLVESYQHMGGLGALFIAGVLGLFLAMTEYEDQRIRSVAALLFVLALIYSFYPVLSGQFFDYHWMPFACFGSLCAALVLLPPTSDAPLFRRLFPLFVFLFSFFLIFSPDRNFISQLRGLPMKPPVAGRVDEIASFLQPRLQPGDTVQPLDWTGGALHAMLLARAVTATPYIYDYHFYHHVDDPFIRMIRARFIARLREQPPKFVIHVLDEPRPLGPGTSTEFPELQRFLAEKYSIVRTGHGYEILQRNE